MYVYSKPNVETRSIKRIELLFSKVRLLTNRANSIIICAYPLNRKLFIDVYKDLLMEIIKKSEIRRYKNGSF
jgi:hypothetical protein